MKVYFYENGRLEKATGDSIFKQSNKTNILQVKLPMISSANSDTAVVTCMFKLPITNNKESDQYGQYSSQSLLLKRNVDTEDGGFLWEGYVGEGYLNNYGTAYFSIRIAVENGTIIKTTEYVEFIIEESGDYVASSVLPELAEQLTKRLIKAEGNILELQINTTGLTENKQDKFDEKLNTSDKTVVGAINDLNERTLDLGVNKQNKTDYDLKTSDKTVVGAINELNTAIVASSQPATTENFGFVKYATDEEATEGVLEDKVINPKQLKSVVEEFGGKINIISVNGVEQTIDKNKTVDLSFNKITVGLENVDNTSDLDKPMSNATKQYIDENGGKIDKIKVNDVEQPIAEKTINITVPTQASDINALPNTIKYGSSLSLVIDNSTFVITAQLKDQDGNNLGTAQTIDMPLESVVVNGSYSNGIITLVLKNGTELPINVSTLVKGLVPDTRKINGKALTADIELSAEDVGVPEWARQPSKPEYDYNEIQNTPIVQSGGNPIGSIIVSTCKQNDAGLHLADGTTLNVGGAYDAFCKHVIKHQADFPHTDLATYELELETFGQCGKYVITESSVKLPKITKQIESANSEEELGQSLSAGLPNIKGQLGPDASGGSGQSLVNNGQNAGLLAEGAFSRIKTGAIGGFGEGKGYSRTSSVDFDASRSSAVYGKSDTVQTQATKYYFYIVVGTVTKTDIEVNIDNVATDLNNKADKDLGNIVPSQLTKSTFSSYAMPSDVYETLTPTNDATYTAPANGYYMLYGITNSTSHAHITLSSSTGLQTRSQVASVSGAGLRCYLPVKKGDVVTVTYNRVTFTDGYFRFIYALGEV